MKRKIPLSCLILSCFLVALAASGTTETSEETARARVQPGVLSARLLIESAEPISIAGAYYAPESPRTLVIDVPEVRAVDLQPVPASESGFIKSVRVEENGGPGLQFRIDLSEKVPYRIITDGKTNAVELNKILRTGERYVVTPETRNLLEGKSPVPGRLTGIRVDKSGGETTVHADLTGQWVAQVFALEAPQRLVVDLFDTEYKGRPAVHRISDDGVSQLRVNQFALNDPHTITRLVFDLDETVAYTMDSHPSGMAIGFNRAKPADIPIAAPTLPATAFEIRPEPTKTIDTSTAPPAPVPARTLEADTPPPAEARTVVHPIQETQFQPRIIAAEEEKYSGEVLSLKFKDADLRDVVLYLAEFAGLNVVFDPDVRGTVTTSLEAVPWDQALDVVLRFNKMGKTIEGNVLRIAPISVLTREDEEQRRLKESKELAGPLHVKTVTLSYSKARDVAGLLRSRISNRGELVIDERTNTIIISEVRDRMDLLTTLIDVLDTPTPQVSIEARIVEATSTFVRNLGIQWGYRGIADPFYGNQTAIQFPNKAFADGALIPQGIVTKGIGGPLGGYAVNLPAPAFNTAVGFSFANVLDTFRLDIALSALETSGNGRIISSPKVTTQNNQAAEIVQGRQIPVQTVANFTVTTRYVNAALELKATPQITAEGTVIMFIEIQNNAADFANLVNGIPPITTQSAKTTVMIPDGGTTVIGGIYRTEDSVTRERVPVLHSIPLLGNLFRNFARTKQNRELLIFITPRIIK
ncbi:MAG: type IV pilus secretin PilQ [Acidobacteriota bacterium]|nr:type IV pilus secretin PilQ [Acidobacteriota bacterium]